ncbi:MAG TPA: 3-dehydroquinate synthase, partial [Candidatus Hydrogenedentes bacterium]|nr:3-dehydroquinate synthase [Candidatus Hydrogenedentota bacterium]
MSNSMTVQSSKYAYEVRFEEDFSIALKDHVREGDIITVDANVLKLYGRQLAPILADTPYVVIEPSETQKSYQGVEPFIRRLIESGFRKNNRLVAVGGGITQDVTAFTASIL